MQDIWQPLRFFAGSWQGTGKGKPGHAAVTRTYEFVLNGRFLQVRNLSAWQKETHEDLGFIGYDRARRQFVFRQFHVEGFVNQYVLEVADGGKTLIFTSEAIENIPAGWRARETYRILDGNNFTETFELAPAGATFEIYSESTLRRKR